MVIMPDADVEQAVSPHGSSLWHRRYNGTAISTAISSSIGIIIEQLKEKAESLKQPRL